MADLGRFIINTSIKLAFNIGDFTSWYTDKLDVRYPGIAMKLVASPTRVDYLTYWLVGETDPYQVEQLDNMSMRVIDSSW